MQPERPIVVERNNTLMALTILAVLALGVLALVTGFIFYGGSNVNQGPNTAPGAVPQDDSVLPTLPPIDPQGEGSTGALHVLTIA